MLVASAPAQPKPPTPFYPPSEIDGKSLSQWLNELKNNDPSVREEAIRAVVLFGPPDSATITALLDRLVDRDGAPRARAIMALAVMDIPKSDVSRVVEALGKRVTTEFEPQSAVRYVAAVAMTRFGEDARVALPNLVKATEDQATYDIRRAACAALSMAGHHKEGGADPRATRALIGALKDPALSVRLEAIMGLGNLGRCSDPTAQTLAVQQLTALSNDRDKVVAIWATVSLMQIDKPVDTLIASIARYLEPTHEVRVRNCAARALGHMNTRAKAHVNDLCKMLKDKEVSCVVSACWALSRMGPDAHNAVVFLKEMAEAKEGDERIKFAAKMALEAIAPKPAEKREP
jgi:HEAT repeat protein